MLQMCCAPCCQIMRREAAVYAINNPGTVRPPHSNFANNFASHIQAQLVNWRPSVYRQGHESINPTYHSLCQHAMAMHQHTHEGAALPLHVGDHEEKPQHFPQQNAFGHQQEHPFFDEQVNYRPEQSMLFNPWGLGRFAHDGISRKMDTLTRPFDPTHAQTSDNVSFSSIGKCEEVIAMPLIQTNVDPNQFQLVKREDWSQASIAGFGTDDEEDALSPASTEATSHGPYTPTGPEGDTGFPEAAMRRFSQELSTSFESTGADMFRDMRRPLDFPSGQFSRSKQVAVTRPPHFDHHQGSQLANDYGALPYSGNNAYSYPAYTTIPVDAAIVENNHQMLMSHATFRDANGLPSEPNVAPLIREQRASTSTGASTSSARTSVRSSVDTQSEEDVEPEVARRRRNDLLLDLREQGHTYKYIKRYGKFTEAESTLRGRVRQLTKDKSERVRRPQWTDEDVRLLRSAVRYHKLLREEGAYVRHRDGKLPWKQIAERMKADGASYVFAPATCAKKYEEIAGR